MPREKDQKRSKIINGASQDCNAALAELYKALKALTFYPENHPLRNDIMHKAHLVMANLLKEGGLALIVRRDGLSFVDRDVPGENTPMTSALAKELFAREVQQLTMLPELSLGDFTEFLSVLAMEPHTIIAEGGLTGILAKRGIQTIIANEIDISAVFTKKMAGESSDETVSDTTGVHEGPAQQESLPVEESVQDQLTDLQIEELIALMNTETDDNRYRQLARILLMKGLSLKEEDEFDRLFPILLNLMKQNADERKNNLQHDCAFAVFQQLALGELAEHLLDHLEKDDFNQKDAVYMILNRLGADVVDAVIKRIVAVEGQTATKSLTAALLRIGPPALPSLTRMLKDNNWQVVRTAAVIMGEMGNRGTVNDLTLAIHHIDNRVRMEAIRSLARIGGREATEVLIDLLQDKNMAVRKQAASWMGITRNDKALEPLLQLVNKRDLLGKTLPLKKEALLAIGRIGDQRALDPLYRLVKKRHMIAAGRWEELKILAVEIIGQLGGDSSKEFLGKIAARGGHIGKACSKALDAMGQRTAIGNE
jgi:HEAT repeat protein